MIALRALYDEHVSINFSKSGLNTCVCRSGYLYIMTTMMGTSVFSNSGLNTCAVCRSG